MLAGSVEAESCDRRMQALPVAATLYLSVPIAKDQLAIWGLTISAGVVSVSEEAMSKSTAASTGGR